MSTKSLQPVAVATDNAWTAFGAPKPQAVQLPTDDAATYIYVIYPDTFRQSYTLTASRGIPTTATITAVTGSCRADGQDLTGGQGLRVLTRLGGLSDNFTITMPDGISSWASHTAALPRPGGGSWTAADLNDLTLELGVNLNSWNFAGGLPGIRVTTLFMTATFTQAAPLVVTNAATSVNVNSATLNGSVDPEGATSFFPVSYFFQWGTTAAYGNVTSTVNGNTGNSPIAVSANLAGLSANTTYHFRLVGSNTDNVVNGSDRTFTTTGSDTALMVF